MALPTKKKAAAPKRGKPKPTASPIPTTERASRSPRSATTDKRGLDCRFYRTEKGNEPVRAWLKGLSKEVRQEIGSDIQTVQTEWPIGKPLVDGLGAGLFEVRSSHDGNIYRVLFCLSDSTMVLLHGFEKKTQKTPKADLDLARRRQSEIEYAS